MSETKKMIYSPRSGLKYSDSPVVCALTPQEYRVEFSHVVWEYDPWTGERRSDNQIKRDPYGVALVPIYQDKIKWRHFCEIDPPSPEDIQVTRAMDRTVAAAISAMFR